MKHGDISVISDRLQLVYGADAKPETALFTGHVSATQNDNNTQADAMTYYLSTQRLQATGNVKSKVIQKKVEGPKKGGPDEGSQAAVSYTHLDVYKRQLSACGPGTYAHQFKRQQRRGFPS